MGKQLKFTYGDTEYTLEYCRKSVEIMERNGFNARDIGTKMMTTLPELFFGGFIMHHRHVTRAQAQEMYDAMEDKEQLVQALTAMFNEPYEALLAEPSGKKVKWKLV